MNYNSYEFDMRLLARTKPSMAYDGKEDFVQWQKTAKEKLFELLGMDSFEKCDDGFEILSETDCGTYTKTEFHFQSEEDCFVPCCMLVPKNVKLPAPTMICLQGHSTGMHISYGEPKFDGDAEIVNFDRDCAVRAAAEGCVAVCIEQRYMGIRGQNPENGTPACLDNTDGVVSPAMVSLMLGRTAIGERVWDISRFIDLAEKHFADIMDFEKLICFGGSGGGTATFYASCLDERIRVSAPLCALCTYDASIMAMYHCSCNYVPGIRKYFNMGDLCGLILPRKLVIISGDVDTIFPIKGARESFECASAMYERFADKDDCVHVIGSGGHRPYPDDMWPVIHKFID